MDTKVQLKSANLTDTGKFFPVPGAVISTKDTHNLDTLAQLTGLAIDKGCRGSASEEKRDGVGMLRRRAKSKYFTQMVAVPLAELRNGLQQYYRNAFYCNNALHQEGITVTSKYCNTRICNTCNRIRTAKLINGYAGELQKIPNKRFVTLTVPNVPAIQLRETIDGMIRTFQKMLKKYSYDKKSIAGLRKLEITYNAVRDDYHPHFHLIIDTLDNAKIIQDMWLKLNPTANLAAQDIREVDDNSMIELFKYSTKVVTDVKGNGVVNVQALDTIMHAIYKRRIIQPFGNIKKDVSEEVSELQSATYPGIPEYDVMEWYWEKDDWVNEYGELLTGHSSESHYLNSIQIISTVDKYCKNTQVIHSG